MQIKATKKEVKPKRLGKKRRAVLLTVVNGHVSAALRIDLATNLLGDDVGSNLKTENYKYKNGAGSRISIPET